MNYGKVETCPHLMAMLNLIRNSREFGVTTQQLHEVSGSMAPSTDVSAIRHQGYDIVSQLQKQRSATGRKIYRYWLREYAPAEFRRSETLAVQGVLWGKQ